MNIQIINQNDELFVDSRTVASGFEIEHESLVKGLKKYFPDLESEKSKSTGGRPQKYYTLTERQVMIVPSFCQTTHKTVVFQIALVDAFLAMRKQATALPTDPAEQALLLATQLIAKQKVIDTQTKTIEVMKPKVKYFDTVALTQEWVPLSIFGKISEIGPGKIFDFCQEKGYLYYNNKKRVPKQGYIDRRLFKLIETIWKDDDGIPHRNNKICVSAKGQMAILNEWNKQRQVEFFND